MSPGENPTPEELREGFRKLGRDELRAMWTPMRRLELTDEAIAALRAVLTERHEPIEDPAGSRCPQCAAPLDLEAGLLVTKDRFLGELFEWLSPYVPFSIWPITRFTPDGGGPKRLVLSEYNSRRAARCRRCGLILCPGPVDTTT